MEIKRCYPTLVGASVGKNQLCNGESVTVPNGHKFYLKKSGTESLGTSAGSAITGLTSGSDMVIDLTQMLGSTIADYAYSLEQATAGSGIAWLRSYDLITDEYKPYNTGTIESVEATAKVVRDENGENAVTYPLGNDVLNGIFKLDASNRLYAYGDRKTSDGVITRNMKLVDLGTLIWYYSAAQNFFSASLSDAKLSTKNIIVQANAMKADRTGWANMVNGEFGFVNDSLRIHNDNYASSADFVANYASGKYCLYETATPTTEQSTHFTSPQIVYPDGTEEFVTENGVPVGHETKYQL